jgi:acetylornithine deacetylase/succinyl-diaminopimelate desuccinylase-like protein
MKLMLVGVIEAAERELTSGKQPRRTIVIGLGHDEEAGGANGAKVLARLLRRIVSSSGLGRVIRCHIRALCQLGGRRRRRI